MRIRSIVLSALVSLLVSGTAMAQAQPQIYPLNDDGTQGQPVSPRPVQPNVGQYRTYSQQPLPSSTYRTGRQQPVQPDQGDDQQQLPDDQQQPSAPPQPYHRAARAPSRAIQVAHARHLWQIILIPKDESVSSEAAVVMLKVSGRDECQKRILALYTALGDEDDSVDEPDFTFACQPVTE